jgi:hypothetical protein
MPFATRRSALHRLAAPRWEKYRAAPGAAVGPSRVSHGHVGCISGPTTGRYERGPNGPSTVHLISTLMTLTSEGRREPWLRSVGDCRVCGVTQR